MDKIPFKPYTGQGKLRFWCQKVLPLVYDDSLSYYELLGKVVEYLNNTIKDVSACEDNITALRDAFIQLQNYVNEMFDDFAPEIERIIDEMIDNGEFGEILTDVVNGLIANEYSTTQGYAQFDYVIKDGKLYCATASTSGEWDAAKWRETTIGNDLQLISRRLYNLNAGHVSYDKTATYDNDTVGKELQELDESLNDLPANRLKGKKIAIYGDSWASPSYGELGKAYIESVTGVEVHRKNFGGGTLAQVYSQCWDNYNADIYIIEAGINDQIGETSGNTFAANINTWLTAIRGVNATAEIYFVTIPYVTSLLQNDKMYPPEFFRIAIWALSGWKKFGVINALKWTDIELLSDRLHPTESSYDKIGKHIVSALINFGDEETHVSEWSNFGRANNQLILVTRGGSMFIQTQNLSVTSDNNSWYNMTINDNLNTVFANGETAFMNETTLQIGLVRYQTLYPKKLLFTGAGITSGAVISNPSVLLPIWVNDWYRPKFT